RNAPTLVHPRSREAHGAALTTHRGSTLRIAPPRKRGDSLAPFSRRRNHNIQRKKREFLPTQVADKLLIPRCRSNTHVDLVNPLDRPRREPGIEDVGVRASKRLRNP